MLPTNAFKRRQGYQRLDGDEGDDNNWLIMKAIGTTVMLSLITLAFLRADRNGAFTTAGSETSDVTTVSTVSLSDNALQHEWNHIEDGEWSTADTTTSTTPARNGGLYAVATNEYSYLNQKMFAYPFLNGTCTGCSHSFDVSSILTNLILTLCLLLILSQTLGST